MMGHVIVSNSLVYDDDDKYQNNQKQFKNWNLLFFFSFLGILIISWISIFANSD